MQIQKKYKNLLISLGISIVLVALSFLFFYPSNSELGEGFTVGILYMLARYVILYLGCIALLARLVKILKDPTSILYVFPGTVNMLVGISSVIQYFMGDVNREWLHKCLLNLLIGIIIVADVFSLHNEFDENRDDN